MSEPRSGFAFWVVRHGHATPAGKGEPDIGRYLSIQGTIEARQLGKTFWAAGLVFDLAITSAACRARQTQEIVSGEYRTYTKVAWAGTGNELYGPKSDDDLKTLFAHTDFGEDPCKYYTGERRIIDAFMAESHSLILGMQEMKAAKNVVYFGHQVMGQFVAASLFPQHLKQLMVMEMQTCDMICVTASGCTHYPLLRMY